jgi:hypothetical protein
MKKGKLPKSMRIYIRREKARIRREVKDLAQQRAMLDALKRQFPQEEVRGQARGM